MVNVLALTAVAETVEVDPTFILQYIKPELLIVAVALYVLGIFLKKSNSVPDKRIPTILLIVAFVCVALYVVATSTVSSAQDVCMLIFTILIQTILITSAPVFISQLLIQAKKNN